MTTTEEPKVKTVTKIQDVAGEYGFRIRWEYAENDADAVSFVVWQIVGHDHKEGAFKLALFVKEGDRTKEPFTTNIVEAEPYLSGAIKNDGRVWFTGSSVMRGALGVKKHMALVKYLWFKAHKLFGGDEGHKKCNKEWKQTIVI